MSSLHLDLIGDYECFNLLNALNERVRNVICHNELVGKEDDQYKSAAHLACTLRAVCHRYYERSRAGVDAYLAYRQLRQNPARPMLSGESCLVLANPIGGLSRGAIIELAREFERRMPMWHATPLRQAGATEGGIALPHSLEIVTYWHTINVRGGTCYRGPRIRNPKLVEQNLTASIRPTNLSYLSKVGVWREAEVGDDTDERARDIYGLGNPVYTANGWTSPSLVHFMCRYGVPLYVFKTFVEALRERGFVVVEFSGVHETESSENDHCKSTLTVPSRRGTNRQRIITQSSLVHDFGYDRTRDYRGMSGYQVTVLRAPSLAVRVCEQKLREIRERYRRAIDGIDRSFPVLSQRPLRREEQLKVDRREAASVRRLRCEEQREVQRAEAAVVRARADLSKSRRQLDVYRERWRRNVVHSSTP